MAKTVYAKVNKLTGDICGSFSREEGLSISDMDDLLLDTQELIDCGPVGRPVNRRDFYFDAETREVKGIPEPK